MDVRFVAGFSPIVTETEDARRFYGEKMSLPLKIEPGSDYTEIDVPGLKHFGLWTLRDASQSTFGTPEWPADVPRPQATLELEVDDVDAAVSELRDKGVELLQEHPLHGHGFTIQAALSQPY